ncbi:MAG: BON domain-containing protein [Planctomycetota bacterium]|nr:BON domain-containing protein [Planctomycetota bacterium]
MSGQTEIRQSRIAEHAEIQRIAHTRLAGTANIDFRHLSCNFDDGVLTLRGRVGSYYHKQLAQENVRHVDGVVQVVNEIEVQP